MKKLALCFLVLTFFSCSTEDSSNSGQSTAILPKKIINTDQGETSASIFNYTDNKITTIDNVDNNKIVITYSGNLITKVEGLRSNNTVDRTLNYTYTNGKLATYSDDEAYPYIDKSVFTHNTDGTITVLSTIVNVTTNAIEPNGRKTLTFNNGNLIKSVYTPSYSTDIYTTNYEYDTKNNPFKNVEGCSAVLGYLHNDFGNGSVNNLTKSITTNNYNSDSEVDLTTYTYEDNGYPKESFATARYVGKNQYFY